MWDRDAEEPVIEARLANDENWHQLDLAETDEETILVQVMVRPEAGVSFTTVGALKKSSPLVFSYWMQTWWVVE